MIGSLFSNFYLSCKYCEIFKSKECTKKALNNIDLVSYFKNIVVEKNQDNYRPDITLMTDDGKNIFVEITVTHPCEKSKIESGNSIIEINIKNESDIKIIYEKKLSEESGIIKLHNFEDLNIFVEPFCNDEIISNCLIILKDGRKIIGTYRKKEICINLFRNKEIVNSAHFLTTTVKKRPMNNYYLKRTGSRIDDIDSNKYHQNNRKKYYSKKKRKK